MAQETIQVGWLKDNEGNKFSPKTLASQIITDEGNLIDSLNDRYITAGQVEEMPIGERATAEGYNNNASGQYSHVEGNGNIVYGANSHAEGSSSYLYDISNKTQEEIIQAWENGYTDTDGNAIDQKKFQAAIGACSHVEGINNLTIGNYSHVEGVQNKAYTEGHAEGQYNVANQVSHAEGNEVKGWGICSHAEGSKTFTKGYYSHAEGAGGSAWEPYDANGSEKTKIKILNEWNNQQTHEKRIHGAIGNASHVEGQCNLAYGAGSHAEGGVVLAYGTYSHAEGMSTEARGSQSHSENYKTQSIGDYSHAGGDGAIANSVGSFAHGDGVQTGGKITYVVKYTINRISYTGIDPETGLDIVEFTLKQTPAKNLVGETVALQYAADMADAISLIVREQVDNVITVSYDANSINVTRGYICYNSTINTSADYSTALGVGTYASLAGQLVTGAYNIPNQDSLFIVGYGTDAENRSNAFEVKTDGTVVADTFDGIAKSATKLQISRAIQTNLNSANSARFDGTSNIAPGVTGTLPLAHGGTGATTAEEALTNLGAQATITGAATTITESDLTADKVLVSDSAGKVAVSSVTSTELEHLSGVTSNVQTQLNSLIKNLQDDLSGGYGSAKTSSIVVESFITNSDVLARTAPLAKEMYDNYGTAEQAGLLAAGITSNSFTASKTISSYQATIINSFASALGYTINAKQGDYLVGDFILLGLAAMGISRSDTLTNSASGVGALAIGADNISAGLGSLAVGYKAQAGDPNDLESMQSPGQTAIGWNVKATGDGALAFGRDTEASGNYSAAIGYGVKATGNRAFAFGSDHDLTQSSDSHVYINNFFINYNRINNTNLTSFDFDGSHGNHSATFGSNKVEGSNTFAAGNELWAAGECNAAFGQLNTVANDCTKVLMSGASNSAQTMHSSIIGGQMNDIRNTSDILAVGAGLKIDGGKTSVIGKYNKHDINNLFEIGNGDDASSRNNAFAVTSTGAIAHGNNATASGKYSYAGGDNTTASGNYSHAEGQTTIATHPGAHAEGTLTEARNNGAHAEGWQSVASGDSAHAEGWRTTASGDTAHAEGGETQAKALRSHAEGYKTIASYNEAHAEGEGSEARSWASHAEGAYCIAGANCSHAGGVHTETNAEGQTAIGIYNALDANALFIVGNGSSENTRSNAFTVNKDGTATLGADPADGMHATTKTYVDEKIAAAAAGLLKRDVRDTLPDTADDNTIYMIPGVSTTTGDTRDEYMYINGAWELIGNTRVDLSNYVTNTSLSTTLNSYLPITGGNISGRVTIDGGLTLGSTSSQVDQDYEDEGVYFEVEGEPGAEQLRLSILGTWSDEPVEIYGVATPTKAYSAVNKYYVDTNFLKIATPATAADTLDINYRTAFNEGIKIQNSNTTTSFIDKSITISPYIASVTQNETTVDKVQGLTFSREEPSNDISFIIGNNEAQEPLKFINSLTFKGFGRGGNTTIDVNGINTLTINKLVINTDGYGEELPTSGIEGQVFFKVVSG